MKKVVAVIPRLPITAYQVRSQSGHVRYVMDNVVLELVLSE
jgi:hypothetical protein